MVKKKMTLKSIGQTIRLRRKKLGLTQKQAAEKCDMGLTTYKYVENGYKGAGLDAYETVANVFKIEFSITFPIKIE